MALARSKTWVADEVLYAADLNGEFDSILNNALSLISPLTGSLDAGGFDITALDELGLSDASAVPTSGRVRRNGSALQWLIEDARTNSVVRLLSLIGTTSGAPAAGIGAGMLFRAESADENPSDFGALDFVASDVGAGTEDTYASLLLRVAGGALDEKYRFQSTAGSGFTAIFTHAATADRTYTLPDASVTLGGGEDGTWASVARAKDTIYQNTTGKWLRIAINTEHGDADSRYNMEVGSASPPASVLWTTGSSAADGSVEAHNGFVIIPNNWYFRWATTGAGSFTLNANQFQMQE